MFPAEPPPLPPPSEPYYLVENGGGDIYLFKQQALRVGNRQVVVRGMCASAYTMLALYPKNVCVTEDAELWFHQGWTVKDGGVAGRSEAGTADLLSMYPRSIVRWIAERGGLTAEWIKLKGKELQSFLPLCRG